MLVNNLLHHWMNYLRMTDVKRILDNQKEVSYLTYFFYFEKDNGVVLELATVGVNKKYKFSDEKACLCKLVDILFELKKLESWAIKREGKRK
jgi:hypothetical protein